MEEVIHMLGLGGVVAITISYLLLSTHRLKADTWVYPFVNFVGASFIVFSLLYDWNLSAFLMETSWALISLYAWVKNVIKARS